jgi:preprotein translocase subunit SecF
LLAVIGVSWIREFLLPIIFGLVAGTYSSVLISGPIWSFIYKKDKDKRLKKKIEQEKNKDKNKIPDDKIVV